MKKYKSAQCEYDGIYLEIATKKVDRFCIPDKLFCILKKNPPKIVVVKVGPLPLNCIFDPNDFMIAMEKSVPTMTHASTVPYHVFYLAK